LIFTNNNPRLSLPSDKKLHIALCKAKLLSMCKHTEVERVKDNIKTYAILKVHACFTRIYGQLVWHWFWLAPFFCKGSKFKIHSEKMATIAEHVHLNVIISTCNKNREDLCSQWWFGSMIWQNFIVVTYTIAHNYNSRFQRSMIH
jgi:hypothetical protein